MNTDREQKRNLKTSNLPEAIERARGKVVGWERMLTAAVAAIPTAKAGLKKAQAKLDDLEKRAIREQIS